MPLMVHLKPNRKQGVKIGDDIYISLAKKMGSSQVRLVISAPKEVAIRRIYGEEMEKEFPCIEYNEDRSEADKELIQFLYQTKKEIGDDTTEDGSE